MYTMVVLATEIVILRDDNSVVFTFRRDDFSHALETFQNLHASD